MYPLSSSILTWTRKLQIIGKLSSDDYYQNEKDNAQRRKQNQFKRTISSIQNRRVRIPISTKTAAEQNVLEVTCYGNFARL